MDKLYLVLLIVAAFFLLLDTFSETSRANGRRAIVVKWLPLGLFFWILVPLIMTGDKVF